MTLAPPDSMAISRGPLGEALTVVVLRPTGNGRPATGKVVEPPLAALTLAAWLRKSPTVRADDSLRVVDAALEGWNLDQTCEQLVALAPDVCLIDGEGATLGHIEALCQALGDRLPEVQTVLIAGHASEVDQAPLDLIGLSFAVHGDPGRPLQALLEGLSTGRKSYDDVPGLDWRNARGHLVRQEALPPAEYLPATPAPAWDLIDLARYSPERRAANQAHWISLITSRACPPDCPTCRNAFGRVFRVREMDEVIAELRELVRSRAPKIVQVADEVFNHDLPRAKAFLRAFLREAPDARLELRHGLRPDRVDAELAELLFRSGLRSCTIILDSASPSVQRALRHNIDLDTARSGLAHLTRAGLFLHGSFSLGWPQETLRERALTARFAKRSALHTARFHSATSDNSAGIEVPLEGLGIAYRAAFWATVAFYAHPARLRSLGRWCLRRIWAQMPQAQTSSLPS